MANIGTGGVEPTLWCQFQHEDLSPQHIKLPLGVGGVSWEYTLNTSVQDTYGGQVVQILGVTVSNLLIRGNFGGPDPQWGAEHSGGSYSRSRFGDYNWIQEPGSPWINGIQQMADWFRQYFEITTQNGTTRKGSFEKFNETPMRFIFPGRGWNFYIRPKTFPKVLMSNANIAPEWTVEADFVEEAERDRGFVKDVEKTALNRLEELKVGIGFQKRNPFSEFINEKVTSVDAANKIIDSYQTSVDEGLSEAEIDELIEFGFSYPGSAYKRAKLDPKDYTP